MKEESREEKKKESRELIQTVFSQFCFILLMGISVQFSTTGRCSTAGPNNRVQIPRGKENSKRAWLYTGSLS